MHTSGICMKKLIAMCDCQTCLITSLSCILNMFKNKIEKLY